MKIKLMLWAMFALIVSCGAVWAQDGGSADLGLGVIGAVIMGTLIPFLASVINQRSFSSAAKGWIVTGLCVLGAVAVQVVTGGFRDGFSGETLLLQFGIVLNTSQMLHRLFGQAFKKLEDSTSGEPAIPTVQKPAGQVKPPAPPPPTKPQTTRDILEDVGEDALRNIFAGIVQKEISQLKQKLAAAPIPEQIGGIVAGAPVTADADLSDVDATGVIFKESEQAPELAESPSPLMGTVDFSAAKPISQGA